MEGELKNQEKNLRSELCTEFNRLLVETEELYKVSTSYIHSFLVAMLSRKGRDNGLFITLVPKFVDSKTKGLLTNF